MLKKSLVKVGFVGFGNVLNAVLGFTFLAVVARSLDLNTFGKYALLTTLLVSISRLIDFGTNSVFVAKSISSQDNNLKSVFFSTKIILTLATFPLYIITLALLHNLDLPTVIILFVGSFAYAINYTAFAVFQKDEKYLPLIMLNLLPSIIKGFFAAIIFFSILRVTLVLAISIFSFSMLASAILLCFLPKNYLKFRFSFTGMRDLLKTSYPAGVSQMVAESWPSISNAVAKVSGGFINVGIFSLASKISHFFALASLSIFTVLLPKNATRKKLKLTYDFSETLLISFVILIGAGISIPIAHLFINNFFGAKFQGSLSILNILIISAALTSIHTFIENFFFVEQKTEYIMFISLGKLAVFILMAISLVPVYSLQGLALSDLIASITAIALTAFLIRKSVRS